jgi:SAM-dependent methyltransferase
MGIGVGQSSMLRVLVEKGVLKSIGNICELGSQETIPSELKGFFKSIGDEPPEGNYDARQFYAALGINDYTSIDLNGELGAHDFDLNLDLLGHYNFSEVFDMVTNFGTAEHCFNQNEVFRNIHNLCAEGGYMLHTAPSQGWIGHCFYRYDENVFRDIAQANGYELVYMTPYVRMYPGFLNSIGLCRTRLFAWLLRMIEWTGKVQVNTTLTYILRKRTSADFVVPIQGVYQETCVPST